MMQRVFIFVSAVAATATVLSACGASGDISTQDITEGQTVSVGTSEATTVPVEMTTPPVTLSDGHGYVISNVIDQRTTSFGDMGCGGAAGLMALQALGFLADKDTDEEYSSFWSTVPKSSDSTKGWNPSSGIWNPAYADWLGEYANTQRLTELTSDDIKQRLSDGQIVIPLVSLGDTGTATHWFTVYGWYEQEGVTLFKVADPWAGGLREYTSKRLQERIDEGARRKSLFGVGSESDGVALWK